MPLASGHLHFLRTVLPQSSTVYAVRHLHCMPAANAVQRPKELVQIVDEDNKALGKATRAEMRAGNLIHRCSFAVVENSQVALHTSLRALFSTRSRHLLAHLHER